MTGIIWVIQRVHYPSFQYVNPTDFKSFTKFHNRSISFIVMPIMIAELITGVMLILSYKTIISFINLFFIILTWLSTFMLSVPLHNKLAKGHDLQIIKKLISTNWPRTFLWTLRSLMLLCYSQFN